MDAAQNHDLPPTEPEETAIADESSILQQEVEQLRQQLDEMKNQWLRAMADLDNTRKRAEREREDTSRYAISGFARDLVSVHENLIRTMQAIPPEHMEGTDLMATLAQGAAMTLAEMDKVLEKHGMRRVDPTGQKFDHSFHQAVSQVEMPNTEPGLVIQCIQSGYVIQDRLLRPALVVVSKSPTTQEEEGLDTSA